MIPFGSDGSKVRGVAAAGQQVLGESPYHLETTFETAKRSGSAQGRVLLRRHLRRLTG